MTGGFGAKNAAGSAAGIGGGEAGVGFGCEGGRNEVTGVVVIATGTVTFLCFRIYMNNPPNKQTTRMPTPIIIN